LKEKVDEMEAQYQTPESAALRRELDNLEKKHQSALQKAEKVTSIH
jgi:hypothetical protein